MTLLAWLNDFILSKQIAAVQKYQELAQKRTQGMHDSRKLNLSREAAEGELKKLRQRQEDITDLSDDEKQSLRETEVQLHSRIQELQSSQLEKVWGRAVLIVLPCFKITRFHLSVQDEENEILRRRIEEYERRDLEMKVSGREAPKTYEISAPSAGDMKIL